jgi:hypothetical protein
MSEESGISVNQAQQEILAEWDKKSGSSLDKGNYVHDGLEKYALTGKYEEDLRESVYYMQKIFKQYYRFYPEVLLHSHKYKCAGRTDLVLQRQKNKSPVLDFMDYKTNESKGIQFDSISRKDVLKHYNKYLLPPFQHLEACNYIIYSLQLSVYAFMAMDTLGIRVGKLAIIFFDNSFTPTYIPVPFMYHEAELLCRSNITRKELPYVTGMKNGSSVYEPNHPVIKEVEKIFRPEQDPIKLEMQRRQYPITPKESFQIKDDWD